MYVYTKDVTKMTKNFDAYVDVNELIHKFGITLITESLCEYVDGHPGTNDKFMSALKSKHVI
jgi:hypothetical protein